MLATHTNHCFDSVVWLFLIFSFFFLIKKKKKLLFFAVHFVRKEAELIHFIPGLDGICKDKNVINAINARISPLEKTLHLAIIYMPTEAMIY